MSHPNSYVSTIVEKISSVQNQHIKEVLKLAKRAVRDERRLTVVEGLREAERALANGARPTEVYLCPSLVKEADQPAFARLQSQLANLPATARFEVTPEVFAKLAYREASDGILLVIPYLDRRLDHLPLGEPPFVCVIEGVEKPGNLGAILRTADAAGVDGLIVCAGGTDVHNPNVVRASLGTLFTVPVAEATSADAIVWLRKQGVQIIATTSSAQRLYTEIDLRGPLAIVMGSEASGLGPAWLAAADHLACIPMHGAADSLNLATATALMLYEVVRQRRFQVASCQ